MPFYEYQCQACGSHHEAMQKMSDAPLRKCPACGRQRLKRLISAPVFRLKGGGWYETDFKSEQESKRNLHGEEAPAKADKGEAADKAEKPEAAAKDAKPEAAADGAKAGAKADAKADAKAGSAAKPAAKATARRTPRTPAQRSTRGGRRR
jgi:putative FmdB family regulatory protein